MSVLAEQNVSISRPLEAPTFIIDLALFSPPPANATKQVEILCFELFSLGKSRQQARRSCRLMGSEPLVRS